MVLDNINIPKDWAMYTGEGNRLMRDMALSFVNRMRRATKYSEHIEALETYFAYYKKKPDCKNAAEAHDTEVREAVLSFADLVCGKFNIDRNIVEEVYNRSGI